MNGRIYDPEIGRFLSADPYVQFPQSTQGYNRYAYLNNNPLNATDPSGFFNLKKELGRALGHIAGYLSFIPGCQLWCSAIAGAVGGYLLTGELKGAVLGGLSGLASGAMAQWSDTGAFGKGIEGWLKGSLTAGAISGGLSGRGWRAFWRRVPKWLRRFDRRRNQWRQPHHCRHTWWRHIRYRRRKVCVRCQERVLPCPDRPLVEKVVIGRGSAKS